MKTKLLGTLIIVFGVFLFAGVVSASDANVLQPASTITYNENLDVNGTIYASSAYIGETGIGGVTFFNGTIVNNSADPVTFGDDVRIDGEIWRGPSKGTSDGQPLKISDTVIPTLTDVNDLGSSENRWQNLYVASSNISQDLYVGGTVSFPDGSINPMDISGTAWTSSNDGAGSGLDADLLDGKDSNSFVSKNNPQWDSYSSYISVSASSFQPIQDGYDYAVGSGQLVNLNGTSSFYTSPVALPHGAKIESMECFWIDQSGSDSLVSLVRKGRADHSSAELVFSATSNGNQVNEISVLDSIINVPGREYVNNYNYNYYLNINLPSSITFYETKIKYLLTQPY